jgi:multicomponent Na+:H+ antiporter subunit D
MITHYPALLVTIPLVSAFIITATGWFNRRLAYPIALVALAVSFYYAVRLLINVLQTGPVSYRLGGWMPPFGIEYSVDTLNGFVLVLVSLVSLLNLLSARKNVIGKFGGKSHAFYALYVLFVTGLMGITVTGDAFNLYVLLEITALTGYAMIGMGREHAALASLNYVFMGTIGASFYLLGVGYLYLATGTLNMADLATIVPTLENNQTVVFAFVFCLIGLFIKMALFPLHNWLPNAYSYAPPAASGLIAPLTTKVMIYVMIRLVLSVFTPTFSFSNELLSTIFVWIATLAIVTGSLLALSQKHLYKMFTYIIVAEVGYMVGGFWLGNADGMTGAILHIANDALMTLCLFLAASNILYVTKSDTLDDLKGLLKKMPLSTTALIIGGLSIIGVPPSCGFFSKWYLIKGGIEAGRYEFVGALLFSSLVNSVLFFKIIEIGYFEPNAHGAAADHHPVPTAITEAPPSMVLPLLITSVLLIAVGLYTNEIVTYIIRVVLPFN